MGLTRNQLSRLDGTQGSNPCLSAFVRRSGLRRTKSADIREGGNTKTVFMYYVYILTCKDHKLYTGCTKDLKVRVDRHQKGFVIATAHMRPVQLLFYFAIKEKSVAYNFEKYLKSGSGRAFLKRHIL